MKVTVNGRASICTWTLTASFLTKEQAKTAIDRIMAEGIDFPVSYCKVFSDTREHHVVEIEEMSWATNLSTVAKILEGVDWRDDSDNQQDQSK